MCRTVVNKPLLDTVSLVLKHLIGVSEPIFLAVLYCIRSVVRPKSHCCGFLNPDFLFIRRL